MASIGGDADRQTPFSLAPSKNPLRRIFPSIQAYATFLCALLVFTIFMAIFLIIAPQVRLVESMICFDYYREHDPGIIDKHGRNIPEKLCKVDSVQEELAFLNGFQLFFANIPGALAAPWVVFLLLSPLLPNTDGVRRGTLRPLWRPGGQVWTQNHSCPDRPRPCPSFLMVPSCRYGILP